jgi:hypothetical protein
MFVLPLASALQTSEGEKPKPPQLRQHSKQEEDTVHQAEKDSCFSFFLFSLFLIPKYRLFLSVSSFFLPWRICRQLKTRRSNNIQPLEGNASLATLQKYTWTFGGPRAFLG